MGQRKGTSIKKGTKRKDKGKTKARMGCPCVSPETKCWLRVTCVCYVPMWWTFTHPYLAMRGQWRRAVTFCVCWVSA